MALASGISSLANTHTDPLQKEKRAVGDDPRSPSRISSVSGKSKKSNTSSVTTGAKRKLFLRTLRQNKVAMNVLILSELSSDDVCLRTFKKKVDDAELEPCFKDAGVSAEAIERLVTFFGFAQEEIANEVKEAFLRPTRLILLLNLVVMLMLGIVALTLYIGELGLVNKGKCMIQDYVNRTCHQGKHANKCSLEVKVFVEDQILTAYGWSPPVSTAKEAGIMLFEPEGPFRCCNEAWKREHAQHRGSLGEGLPDLRLERLGAGIGSGAYCCSLFDPVANIWCDSLGSLPEYPNCHKDTWDCSVRMKKDSRGNWEVHHVQVWSEPTHSAILFAVQALAIFEVVLFLLRFFLSKSELASAAANSLMSRYHRYKNTKEELAQSRTQSLEKKGTQNQSKVLQQSEDHPDIKMEKAMARLPSRLETSNEGTDNINEGTDNKVDAFTEESETESESGEAEESTKIRRFESIVKPAVVKPQTPGSRPGTRTVSKIFRPIISPAVKTRPLKSKKHGFDMTASSFGYTTSDAFGLTGTASTFTDGFGRNSGHDFAAATFSEGFGRGAVANMQVQPRTRPIFAAAAVYGEAGRNHTRTVAWGPQPTAAGHGSNGVQAPPKPTNASAYRPRHLRPKEVMLGLRSF